MGKNFQKLSSDSFIRRRSKTFPVNTRTFLHLWTLKTPTFALKKYKNVKSILMVLLFLLLFGW
jgi:hypothetical protein